jgi:hypothetical protein
MTGVALQAGCQTGAFGIIFDGTIKQGLRGRENPTDKQLDILATDGDIPYNQGAVTSRSQRSAARHLQKLARIEDRTDN